MHRASSRLASFWQLQYATRARASAICASIGSASSARVRFRLLTVIVVFSRHLSSRDQRLTDATFIFSSRRGVTSRFYVDRSEFSIDVVLTSRYRDYATDQTECECVGRLEAGRVRVRCVYLLHDSFVAETVLREQSRVVYHTFPVVIRVDLI